MKKTAISLSMTCLTVALLSSTGAVYAANDGTIEFTGNLIPTTCTVEGSAPGMGNITKTVDLKGVPVGDMNAGSAASSTGKFFSITVGGAGETSCQNGLKASVRFDPNSPAIDRNSGNLDIDQGGPAATNVQVRIFNQGETTPIHLLRSESTPVEIVNNTAELPFVAEYYSAAGNATPGEANTRVGFQVVYD